LTALTKTVINFEQRLLDQNCTILLGILPSANTGRAKREYVMRTLLVIAAILFLLAGSGGYAGYNRYGGRWISSIFGVVLIIAVVLWLANGLAA
jgi:hypothetical protein